ncbi:hypothetical protein QQG74_13000 [Micromonospora sp. FIMYZ51]|uniref:hypothetical protein n=1 Tax=Micromonospora sp. FIMYZ51 TaxID=3051832 RepID=UPI00311E6341
MVVIIEADKAYADEIADARSILLVHRAEPDGLCWGCHEVSCRFAWFPCPQARWAQRVLAADGGDGR